MFDFLGDIVSGVGDFFSSTAGDVWDWASEGIGDIDISFGDVAGGLASAGSRYLSGGGSGGGGAGGSRGGGRGSIVQRRSELEPFLEGQSQIERKSQASEIKQADPRDIHARWLSALKESREENRMLKERMRREEEARTAEEALRLQEGTPRGLVQRKGRR